MQIISRFEHGSTLDSLRLGPEDGHFAVDRDGYAFRRRTAKDAYSGEDVMDYHGKGDRLEIAPSISGSGVIGAGIDGLGNPQDLFIQDEAELKTGNFLRVVHGEIIEVEKARDILGNTQPKAVAG